MLTTNLLLPHSGTTTEGLTPITNAKLGATQPHLRSGLWFSFGTLERNYKLVKEHGGDCYWDGRKGNSGRKKRISDEELEEAIQRIDEGELIDGEDIRHEMFPTVPARTVHNTLSRVSLEGHAQRKKPVLQPQHIQQHKNMF
ncbi:hypothetical protein DFH08DRAFT_815358 [Mycena albidolilacea]|uniref:Uncharacterized protein n=1 Tax=Mycena albidolilacea TaxID=1033008 RepID=A0AAD6ZMQ5_9AGAR|nr:hypothetical protein DFH08DRAFT_815358 [Mycena albidolilacea]